MKPTLNLNTPAQYLKGVGPKMAKKLAKLDIKTIKDLLYYFPRTYLDFSQPVPISRTRIGDLAIIKAKILSISNHRTHKRRMVITKARVGEAKDDFTQNAQLTLVWFNQPFLINTLKPESIWYFYGKINYDFTLREKTLPSPIFEKNSAILPIYPLTEKLTSKYLRRLITPLLVASELSPVLSEFLPDFIVKNQKLIGLDQAIREIHFPGSQGNLSQARQRLAFDELFLIILRLLLAKKEFSSAQSPQIKINKNVLVKFVKNLPYKLTNTQRKTSWEILNDLTKPVPMNRLLEGDVGSGKTIVALMAALNTIKSGFQVLWMAPTEILANQHFQTACKLLDKFNVKISLITSKRVRVSNNRETKSLSRAKLRDLAQNSELIIGTHALIQKDCNYKNIGLVIIDEQHRFGVKQRAQLARGSEQINKRIKTDNISFNQCENPLQSAKVVPHFLSMTATPIPRTLALSIYSDLDISVLDEMPKNRKKIITRLVDPVNREKAYQFIRDQVKFGRQVFIICPLIEEKNHSTPSIPSTLSSLFALDRKSVKAEYEKLSKQIFSDLKISMLHGRMKSAEKEKIMSQFSQGKCDILVSTSVVEVGIDIPNATIMMIEDAERFGLAQLHQFRGRVGRGQHQSYCLLFTNNLSPTIHNRLKKIIECSNGFKLAEEDLKLRGPGELGGIAQSGLPDLKMASLTDIILIKRVREVAEKIIDQGIGKYSTLMNKLSEFELHQHLE